MKALEDTLDRIEAEASKSKREAYNQWLQRNAKAGIGDIVTDGRGAIRVTEVSVCLGITKGIPTIGYKGVEVVKDGGSYRDKKHFIQGYAVQDHGFKLLKKGA